MFCHAGIKKHHLDILDKYNKDIFYINYVWRDLLLNNNTSLEDKEILDKIILDDDGILWMRGEESDINIEYCARKLAYRYIFIGHNPIENIDIVKNRIIYTDTCISRAFGQSTFQYVVIENNIVKVRKMYDTK